MGMAALANFHSHYDRVSSQARYGGSQQCGKIADAEGVLRAGWSAGTINARI